MNSLNREERRVLFEQKEIWESIERLDHNAPINKFDRIPRKLKRIEELDMELGDPDELERAQAEYDRFVEDHSLEVYLADLDDYAEIAETYINESYGGMDYFAREELCYMKDYVDIESFARDLFYDYTFVDGYVFNNY